MKRRLFMLGSSMVAACLLFVVLRLVIDSARWYIWGERVDSKVIEVGSSRVSVFLDKACLGADCSVRIRISPGPNSASTFRTYADTDYRPTKLIVQRERGTVYVGFCDSYVGGRIGKWNVAAAQIEDLEADPTKEWARMIRSICRS